MSRFIPVIGVLALVGCVAAPEVRYQLLPVPGGHLQPVDTLASIASDNAASVAIGNFGDVVIAAELNEVRDYIGVRFLVTNNGTEDYLFDPATVHLLDAAGMVLIRIDAEATADRLMQERPPLEAKPRMLTQREDAKPNAWRAVGDSLRNLGRVAQRNRLEKQASQLSASAIPSSGLTVPPGAWASGTIYWRDVVTTGYQLRIAGTSTSFEYVSLPRR